MKIKSDCSDIILIREPENPWCANDTDYTENVIDELEQQMIVAYLWKNKPELLRDIICENCPEHIGEMERKAYLERGFERGGKK